MPNDNIRSDDHALSTDKSITNSETKGNLENIERVESRERSKPDERLLIIAVIIIIAIADVIIALATRQYMMLVAVNALPLAALPLLRQKEASIWCNGDLWCIVGRKGGAYGSR